MKQSYVLDTGVLLNLAEASKLVTGDGAMIPLGQMTDEQFEQHALSVLHRELGVYGLARFLRVYRAGTGDYTRDTMNGSRDLRCSSWLGSSKAVKPKSTREHLLGPPTIKADDEGYVVPETPYPGNSEVVN